MADLSSIHVTGPVEMLFTSGNTIGRTDNDDLPSFSPTYFNRIVRVVDTGDEPQEIIYNGQVCVISATLVKWDDLALGTTGFLAPGGSTEGDAGTVGSLWVGGSNTFSMDVLSSLTVSADNPTYRFGRCYIDGYRIFDLGNMEKRLAIEIIAMRDGSNNIYTLIQS